MLSALLTVWATSLVVLSLLLGVVIAGQTLLSWTRRLRHVAGRPSRRPHVASRA